MACYNQNMKRIACLVFLVLASGCATPTVPQKEGAAGVRLAFAARPCAEEVHLGLSDITIVDRAGNPVAGAEFRELPTVLVRDGDNETELGKFCEGCGGALRLHVRLPATQSRTPMVVVRGFLREGTPVTGTQLVDASDYNGNQ